MGVGGICGDYQGHFCLLGLMKCTLEGCYGNPMIDVQVVALVGTTRGCRPAALVLGVLPSLRSNLFLGASQWGGPRFGRCCSRDTLLLHKQVQIHILAHAAPKFPWHHALAKNKQYVYQHFSTAVSSRKKKVKE